MEQVHGFKRFLITLIGLLGLVVSTWGLLMFFYFGKVNFADISGLLSVGIMGITGLAGAYITGQSATDYFKKKADTNKPGDPPVAGIRG